jgi:hypothetical protein
MHRDDKSKYLLYIEPKKEEKLNSPIEDNLTKLMEMALSKSEEGTANYSNLDDMGDGYDWTYKDKTHRIPSHKKGSGYKGHHRTECGQGSSNKDYLLENGMITNSLAPFYLRWYRYSIPESDMIKLKELANFYNVNL